MTEPTLEQELTLLAQRLPAFAQVLLCATQCGLIHGAPPMTRIVWPTGDAYQHLAHGDDRQGRELAQALYPFLSPSSYQGQATVPLLASQPSLWQMTEAESGQPEHRRECRSCQKGINP